MSYLVLLTSLILFSIARAQQSASWPQWVTNDYNCVIKCMQQYFTDTQPPATSDQYNNAMGCVKSTCAQKTENANIYQAQYIINMYNQIGSIYEPEDWQNGNIPTNGTDSLTAPTGWVQTTVTTSKSHTDGTWATQTDTVWAPPPPPATTSNQPETTSGAVAAEVLTETKSSQTSTSSAASAASGSTSGGAGRGAELARGLFGIVLAVLGVVAGGVLV
ncbi:hypothetical protein BD324DRAFT_652193 [Kockovaella imperatae]|uniref:Extracellular membrane protein CFEM domain-containing protein n=1 Tax=Kockovaella imperatae TaxID=4999 RepID=A0A1Y1UEZ8_9TREE|nr:hypothetical protein BD324DRAFT_652193 [Kockovaella imperatae]ORX35645.1 hypothetical protein BD324DRAFT_652193 [Kockovaella imperatae]